MSVFLREFGSVLISAIIAFLIVILFFSFSGRATNVHKMSLNNNSYNASDISDTKLKLKREYFTIERNSDAFSTTSKIVNYLKANDYLETTGNIDEYITSPFSSKKRGLHKIKITAINNDANEEVSCNIYVKVKS